MQAQSKSRLTETPGSVPSLKRLFATFFGHDWDLIAQAAQPTEGFAVSLITHIGRHVA
jgi:hypothetical protein